MKIRDLDTGRVQSQKKWILVQGACQKRQDDFPLRGGGRYPPISLRKIPLKSGFFRSENSIFCLFHTFLALFGLSYGLFGPFLTLLIAKASFLVPIWDFHYNMLLTTSVGDLSPKHNSRIFKTKKELERKKTISPEIITIWEELSDLWDWISCSCISERFKSGLCTIASAGIAALQFWAHWMQCSGAAVTSWLGTCDCWCGRCCSGAGRKIPGRERGKAKKRKELWRNGTMEKGVALTLDGLLFYPSWSFPSSLSLPPGKDCQCHYWRWKIPSEMEVLLYTAKTIASMPIYIVREG